MGKVLKILWSVVLVVLLAFVVLSSTSQIEAASQASTDGAINRYVLERAECSLNQNGGQCKYFVQITVYNASGRYLFPYCSPDSWWPKRMLPATQSTLDSWGSATFAVIIRSGNSGLSNYWCFMQPGNIIQFAHKALGYLVPHTIIVEQATPSGIWVVDSNWKLDEIVRRHFIEKSWLDKNSLGWTLYQIR